MLQGIAEEVNKQADQRISSRVITYVPDIHDLALNTQRVGAMKVQKNRKKNSKEIKTTAISRRSTIAERSWSATSTGHRAVQVVDVGALLILEHGTGRRRLLTTEPIPSAFLVSVLHTVSGFGSGHSARGPALRQGFGRDCVTGLLPIAILRDL